MVGVEEDSAIDEPGEVEDHQSQKGEEGTLFDNNFLVLLVGKGCGIDVTQAIAGAAGDDTEDGEEAKDEQPDRHLVVTVPLRDGCDQAQDDGAQHPSSVNDKLKLMYL